MLARCASGEGRPLVPGLLAHPPPGLFLLPCRPEGTSEAGPHASPTCSSAPTLEVAHGPEDGRLVMFTTSPSLTDAQQLGAKQENRPEQDIGGNRKHMDKGRGLEN